MAFSPILVLVDGTTYHIDFITALTASLANLGNIGPAVAIGIVNTGPTGNYFAFSMSAKVIMIGLMYVGRIGMLSVLLMFITKRGEQNLEHEVPETHFDSDLPFLIK